MSSIKLLNLPNHIIEKILSHVERPHDDLALVCNEFHRAVCRINRYHLNIVNFEELTNVKRAIFKSILNSRRRVNVLRIHNGSSVDPEKLIKLLVSVGRNLEETHFVLRTEITLMHWWTIFSLMPRCEEMYLEIADDELTRNSESEEMHVAITHRLKVLDLTANNYWPLLKSFMLHSYTLAQLTLDVSSVDFKDLQTFFKHQTNVKIFSLLCQSILNKNAVVFASSHLERLSIGYHCKMDTAAIEDTFMLMSNQSNLISLSLCSDANISDAIVPIRTYVHLKTLQIEEGYNLHNLLEIGYLESLQRLETNDLFFDEGTEMLMQIELPKVTHLRLHCQDAYLYMDFPFVALSVAMPNLQSFELSCSALSRKAISFIKKCLRRMPLLFSNLTTMHALSWERVCGDQNVDIDCLLDDNRENSKIKTLRLKFPMKLKTVHVLKLIFDYRELEHFELDTGDKEECYREMLINMLRLMIKGWKKLKTIRVRIGSLAFEPIDFSFVVEYGRHLERFSLECRQLENREELEMIFRRCFKSIKCFQNGFTLQN